MNQLLFEDYNSPAGINEICDQIIFSVLSPSHQGYDISRGRLD